MMFCEHIEAHQGTTPQFPAAIAFSGPTKRGSSLFLISKSYTMFRIRRTSVPSKKSSGASSSNLVNMAVYLTTCGSYRDTACSLEYWLKARR